MTSYNWGQWKDYTLIPSLWSNISRIFPSMGFQLSSGGNKWTSYHRLNGEKTSQRDRTYITKQKPHLIGVNGGGEKPIGIIDHYMQLNRKDFRTAIKELSDLCGIPFPETDSEEWKKYEQIQKNRETANEKFKEALFSDDEGAKAVLQYLIRRGWTEEEIEQAELGYIDKSIRDSLPDKEKESFLWKTSDGEEIGVTHRLIIPYRNGTRLLGFKARNINYGQEEAPSKPNKYLNTKGLQRVGLFGLLPMGEDCIVVEGELDALHAKVKKVENIAATTGGGLSEKMISEARRRGYKRFTLLFDNDKSGRNYTYESLSALEGNGEAWVATLPEETKDVDEFLKDHSVEELKEIVNKAAPSYLWKLHQLALSYAEIGELTWKQSDDFLRGVEKIVNSPETLKRPLGRKECLDYLRNNEEVLGFKLSDIEAWLDQSYQRNEALQRRNEAASAAAKASTLIGEGKVDEAIALMGETAQSLKTRDRSAEYAEIFAPMGQFEFEEFLRTIPKGIPTGYKIGREELTLQAGLTFVCGATSHGKSSLLNNILLNVVKWNKLREEGKSVLYFSYEIDRRRLFADLINSFVADPFLGKNEETSPLFAIYSYFENIREDEAKRRQHFNTGAYTQGVDHYTNFVRQSQIFFKEYIETGNICVVDKTYTLENLLNAIRYYLNIRKPSVIFIDYAQLIYKEGQSRQRTEEIKDIVTEIKNLANETGIPIVMAAQFNRSVNNPLDVLPKNIGEAGDLERVADTIVGIFNLGRPIVVSKDEKESYRNLINPLLKKRGDPEIAASAPIEPIPNRMYVALLKRRNSIPDQREIIEWDGRIKTIKPNYLEAIEPQQGSLFPESQQEEDTPF